MKEVYSTEAALTMTGLNSLASSASGSVGVQSTPVDNSVTGYLKIKLFIRLKLAGAVTSNKCAYVNAIRGDKNATPHRSDGAGAAAAGMTKLNAQPLGTINNKYAAAAAGDFVYGEFEIVSPGPEWGVHIGHDFGTALDADAAQHWVRWIGVTLE